jgi:2-keto-4-pentenoate hydratase/2-oxohepta-3-ene-1,7-dioic acid hydratase in catechol pathway
MRLTTCVYRQEQQVGILFEESIALPSLAAVRVPSMLDLADAGPQGLTSLAHSVANLPQGAHVPLREVHLLSPVPRPRKNVICLGLNYAEHAEESLAARGKTAQLPEHPVVFTKAVTSIIGPYDDILYDARVSTQLDWEVELAVVIGVGGRHIPRDRALDHVFGYTVINDISARDLQFRHKQYFLGKSMDGSCPMGPCIVTADEVSDPQCLNLRCWVNGVLKQDSNTRHQIFDVATVIATLSRVLTLEPGDIISTGTPAGVGFARQPPEFLKPGDVVECEVEPIGRLRNAVARAAAEVVDRYPESGA